MRVINGGKTLHTDASFFEKIREDSEQPLELCYQCQKCAAGCPMADHSEYTPNQVLRMVCFGLKDLVLKSSTIWLCTGCEACAARCPNGIRIPEMMDVLRYYASAEGLTGEKQTEVFHRMFLNEVKSKGRVNEGLLMAKYKVKTRQFFSDLDLGLQLFKRGKLSILSSSITGKKQVQHIFEQIKGDREGGI